MGFVLRVWDSVSMGFFYFYFFFGGVKCKRDRKKKKKRQPVAFVEKKKRKKKSFRREEKVVCSPRWVPKILIYLQQCQWVILFVFFENIYE